MAPVVFIRDEDAEVQGGARSLVDSTCAERREKFNFDSDRASHPHLVRA